MVPRSACRARTRIALIVLSSRKPQHGDKMPKLPVIASVAAVLVSGCMSGPSPGPSSNNSVGLPGPGEQKLPGAPAVRAATP